ncbi:MAG TPA: MarR family transcriptional regulator [Cyclobacteriaceae bacterium]|nr:MarR family transcriptional regulator [Cyclobacteriaceae bacterium]
MDTLDILIDIRKIVRSINLESKRVQKDFGISIPQLLCLGHIDRASNKMSTHGELMKLLSLNSSTITGIVNRLEKKELVKRLPKSGDKRVTYLGITGRGSEVVKQAPDILHDQLAKRIKSLPEATQLKIKDALGIIVAAMEIEGEEAAPLIAMNVPIEPLTPPSEG